MFKKRRKFFRTLKVKQKKARKQLPGRCLRLVP